MGDSDLMQAKKQKGNDETFTSLRKQANDRLNKSNHKSQSDDLALALLTEEEEVADNVLESDPFEHVSSPSANDLFADKDNDKEIIAASSSIEAEFAKLNNKMTENEPMENKLNKQQSGNDVISDIFSSDSAHEQTEKSMDKMDKIQKQQSGNNVILDMMSSESEPQKNENISSKVEDDPFADLD